LLTLGQRVDGDTAASNLGYNSNVSVADRSTRTSFDLNALPATGAGPSDLFGFSVKLVSLADALQVTFGGDSSGFMIGGQRLFVYHGIPDTLPMDDGTGALRIPQDAFAHTDPLAVVRLEARLINGLPLPSWLKFDGIGGSFRGVPPAGLIGSLEIEVIARDTEGREARTKFTLEIAALRAAEHRQTADLPDIMLGLDVDAKDAEKARLKAQADKTRLKADADKVGLKEDKPKVRSEGKLPAASFTDQIRTAKASRDPLLDKLARSGPDKPGSGR
jgi:hypothetical protein